MIRAFVYAMGIDTPLMVKENPGGASEYETYVYRDGKSSVMATYTNETGNTGLTKYKMDPWGNGTTEDGTSFKFTSRRLDEETGNYYYRNRYYHARTGRFMSHDPIGYADGMNTYAYVGNDPVNRRDPMGLSMEEIVVTAPRLDANPGQWLAQGIRQLQQYMGTHAFAEGLFGDRPKGKPHNSSESYEEIVVTAQRVKGVDWGAYLGSQILETLLNSGMVRASWWAPAAQQNSEASLSEASLPDNSSFCTLRPNGSSISTKQIKQNIQQAEQHQGTFDHIWFYNQVKTGGPWDFKNLPGNNPADWVDFGNYHFGIVGRAAGYTRTTLLAGAGAYQIKSGTSDWDYFDSYFDDPRDTRMIRLGMDQYDAGCFDGK